MHEYHRNSASEFLLNEMKNRIGCSTERAFEISKLDDFNRRATVAHDATRAQELPPVHKICRSISGLLHRRSGAEELAVRECSRDYYRCRSQRHGACSIDRSRHYSSPAWILVWNPHDHCNQHRHRSTATTTIRRCRVAAQRGYPRAIVCDNGPEFRGEARDQWAHQHAVQLAFIEPGKPVQNAYIESFNGKLRDECLNEN